MPAATAAALSLIAATAGAVLAAEPVPLPTSIVMTEADCKEINEKHTFRGRPLGEGTMTTWDPSQSVWKDLPVFSGKKADVVKWFTSGQPGLKGRESFRSHFSMRWFQYELLCSQLLRSGDVDVIRAVLWHAYPVGTPEWRALADDKRLTHADRIVAWLRTSPRSNDPRGAPKEFWKRFGAKLTPQDVIRLCRDYHFPPWAYGAWQRVTERKPVKRVYLAWRPATDRKTIDRVMLPLLERKNLHVKTRTRSNVVSEAAYALGKIRRDDSDLGRLLLGKLAAWDAAGEKGSHELWEGITLRQADEQSAKQLRAFWPTARFPANAARGFYAYAATPAGKGELQRLGWQAYFDRYLALAFGKQKRDEQLAWLSALAGRRLEKAVIRDKADVVVTEKQFEVLKQVWKAHPNVLERVVVEDEEE